MREKRILKIKRIPVRECRNCGNYDGHSCALESPFWMTCGDSWYKPLYARKQTGDANA